MILKRIYSHAGVHGIATRTLTKSQPSAEEAEMRRRSLEAAAAEMQMVIGMTMHVRSQAATRKERRRNQADFSAAFSQATRAT
jgi:hypothetical protein